jgi:hypothetical protein
MIEKEKILILKFLELNFPVQRYRINSRFQKIILINDKKFILRGDTKELVSQIYHIVQKVFSSDDELTINLVLKFLDLR